jgi:putative FmdB family regulatory protein
MPTYSYICTKCNNHFELFFSIRDYDSSPRCPQCNTSKTCRNYIDDVSTINASIKKNDSELSTLGDLANRNRDKLSEDQKQALHQKHNSYKAEESTKELPKGMSRMKKPQYKPRWR